MNIIVIFIGILFLIKLTKLESNYSILLAILITYTYYKHTSTVLQKNETLTTDKYKNDDGNMEDYNEIPHILNVEWVKYWKHYFKDLKEYNNETYFDVIKSLKYFYQLYNDIFNKVNNSSHQIENMAMLQKEILNLLQSIVINLPVTQQETLENILEVKINKIKNELDFRMDEMRQMVNKDWNEGRITQFTKPVYSDILESLPPDYSPNFSFY
jgi:hypothetical protein